MKTTIAASVRFLRGLRRPSKATNARRLRERGKELNSLVVREATVEDVPALAHLHVTTFNATHGRPFGHRPTFELREAQWTEKFAQRNAGWFCFVTQDAEGNLVGFATGHAYDHPDQPAFSGQLGKIYLLSGYQRLGLGRRLVGHVTRRFLQQAISSMLKI